MSRNELRRAAAIKFLTIISQNQQESNPESSPVVEVVVIKPIDSFQKVPTWRSDDEIPDYKSTRQIKSTTMLSSRSVTSSQVSVIDPLVVYVFGGSLSLFSMIPIKDRKIERRKISKKSQLNPYFEKVGLASAIDTLKKKRNAESYLSYLEPRGTLSGLANYSYDPLYLDDPGLKSGRHKTVITLPSFLGSIMQPSTPKEIKRDLNTRFKELHPNVDPTITLSQIRKLKKVMVKIGQIRDIELSSIAISYVYFEKLVLNAFVVKTNKRLIAAICLLLAVKINDPKETLYAKLLEVVEREWEISPKDVYANEFLVYCALEFNLFIPLCEIQPHLDRVYMEIESISATS